MLEFDAETTRLLEIAYQGSDFSRRRRANIAMLGPEPGETILDIGAGNGMITSELALAVGEAGRVIGIDPSADMRRAGGARCADFSQVAFREGTAANLGVPDHRADRAISVQASRPDISAQGIILQSAP